MKIYLYLAQIVLSIVIIGLVMVQAKDAGLSSMFGSGDMGVYKTRRGVEKTLFNATIVAGSLLMVLAIITVIVAG